MFVANQFFVTANATAKTSAMSTRFIAPVCDYSKSSKSISDNVGFSWHGIGLSMLCKRRAIGSNRLSAATFSNYTANFNIFSYPSWNEFLWRNKSITTRPIRNHAIAAMCSKNLPNVCRPRDDRLNLNSGTTDYIQLTIPGMIHVSASAPLFQHLLPAIFPCRPNPRTKVIDSANASRVFWMRFKFRKHAPTRHREHAFI